MQEVLARVRDASLRHCLQFGVGLHHAGLKESDRQLVESLFVAQRIQVCNDYQLATQVQRVHVYLKTVSYVCHVVSGILDAQYLCHWLRYGDD